MKSLLFFPLAAMASPIVQRAGAPGFVPIPGSCSVDNPIPKATLGRTANGYQVDPTWASANTVYAAYYPPPSNSPSDEALSCFEQCHGLQGCKSALFAYQVPEPKGYAGPGTGGDISKAGCLMYKDYLKPENFVEAPSGQFTNAMSINLHC